MKKIISNYKSNLNFKSICVILLIIMLVGLNNNMLSYLIGGLCDGVTNYNIGIWSNYYYIFHQPIVCILSPRGQTQLGAITR